MRWKSLKGRLVPWSAKSRTAVISWSLDSSDMRTLMRFDDGQDISKDLFALLMRQANESSPEVTAAWILSMASVFEISPFLNCLTTAMAAWTAIPVVAGLSASRKGRSCTTL